MKILFLYPNPAVDRLAEYRKAALTLRDRFGHYVVFVYVGDAIRFSDDLPTEHFDSWVKVNGGLVSATSMLDLEKEFPASNLWRCIVAQRTLTDYSYLGGGAAMVRYPLGEIEWYLKAVVLFYRDVITRYGVQVAMAHAPDGIHAQALYELALSTPIRTINQYYDPYWKRDGRYCVDQVTYVSTWLAKKHREFVEDYERTVRPREQELEHTVEECCRVDPRRVLASELTPTGLLGSLRTAGAALRYGWRDFVVRPRSIGEAYYRYSLLAKTRAFLTRTSNRVQQRLFVPWSRDLPARPFVFFAPHYQPEAATLASAPVWSDMLAIIRMLSASLPAGFQLVVKDHPIIGGHRSAAFYRAAVDLPNVVLLPAAYPTAPLIEKCSMVSTVAGTVGLQALMRGKLLLLFGHVYYDCIDGILRPPPDMNDLPILLKDVLVNGRTPDVTMRRRSLLAFMAAYYSIIVYNAKMESPKTPEEKGEGLAELIDHWINTDLAETTPGRLDRCLSAPLG